MSFRRSTRVRLAAGAVLGVTFTAGLALGFALDRGASSITADGTANADSQPEAPPNDWIVDRLEMADAQRATVDSIVDHYGMMMSDLQREVRPRLRAVVDSANRALRGALTEAQLVQYDSLEAELARRRSRGNPSGRR